MTIVETSGQSTRNVSFVQIKNSKNWLNVYLQYYKTFSVPADRPEYDGGATVQEYEVLMTKPDNTTRNVYAGRDQECAVAGLLPGRPYLFQVRPTNKTGVSIDTLLSKV